MPNIYSNVFFFVLLCANIFEFVFIRSWLLPFNCQLLSFPSISSLTIQFFFFTIKSARSKSSSFSAGDRRNLICMAPSKLTKMSTDQLPLVTALLKASRNQDEDTLRYILSSILKKDAPDENVNAVDCSGRVSTHYLTSIVSTIKKSIIPKIP